MFTGKYLEWNKKRIKTIVDFYGQKYLYFKKVLDLGCGHGDVGGSLQRLGADVTFLDAREEHLKTTLKKFPGAKTIKHNIENKLPFMGKKFDIILDLDLICHIKDYENHIKNLCAITTHLVIETAVLDSNEVKCEFVQENPTFYDLGVSGVGCVPTAAAIEKILLDCGMEFRRVDDPKLNLHDYVYDWEIKNTNSVDLRKRRLWFAKKINSIVKFAPIKQKQPEPVSTPVINFPIPVKKQTYNIENNIENKNIININYKNNIINNSIIRTSNFNTNKKFNLYGNIECSGISASRWISYVKPMFPNLKVKSLNIKDSDSFIDTDLLICDIENIKYAKKIFLLDFFNIEINNNKLDILNKSNYIYTNSIQNAQFLRKILKNKNIEYITKYYPIPETDGNINSQNYFLMINRNDNITEEFLNLTKDCSNIKIIGRRGESKKGENIISNYISYEDFFNLFKECKGLIDFGESNNYQSSLIDLAIHLGKNVLTNNSNYSISKPSINYIKSKFFKNTLIPDFNNLKSEYNIFINQKNISKNNFDIYCTNEIINSNFKSILEQ